MGPEQKRFMERLFSDPSRTLLNFNVVPGDKAATAEQVYGELNKAMDEVERRRAAGETGDGPARSRKPATDLRLVFSNGDNTHRFSK